MENQTLTLHENIMFINLALWVIYGFYKIIRGSTQSSLTGKEISDYVTVNLCRLILSMTVLQILFVAHSFIIKDALTLSLEFENAYSKCFLLLLLKLLAIVIKKMEIVKLDIIDILTIQFFTMRYPKQKVKK